MGPPMAREITRPFLIGVSRVREMGYHSSSLYLFHLQCTFSISLVCYGLWQFYCLDYLPVNTSLIIRSRGNSRGTSKGVVCSQSLITLLLGGRAGAARGRQPDVAWSRPAFPPSPQLTLTAPTWLDADCWLGQCDVVERARTLGF